MNAVIEAKALPQPSPNRSILVRMADRYGIDPTKMLDTLKQTAFKGNVSNEQMLALLVVADQHGLNPWTREIFAFPSQQGIVPVVSVDGWAKIINSHPSFDGMEFKEDEKGEWIECSIYRKDRAHAVTIREWMAECRRDTGPWKSHARRMLRHKSLIQCARIAFSFAGIYDQDEAERIIEAEVVEGPKLDVQRIEHNPDTDQATAIQYATRFIKAMELDKDEPEIAAAVYDIHAEVMANHELYLAISAAMTARARGAVKKYVEMHRKAKGLV